MIAAFALLSLTGESQVSLLRLCARVRIRARVADDPCLGEPKRSATAIPQVRHAPVVGDTHHEGALGALTPKSGKRAPQREQDLLHQVVAISRVGGVAARKPGKGRPAFGQHGLERCGRAVVGWWAVLWQETSLRGRRGRKPGASPQCGRSAETLHRAVTDLRTRSGRFGSLRRRTSEGSRPRLAGHPPADPKPPSRRRRAR